MQSDGMTLFFRFNQTVSAISTFVHHIYHPRFIVGEHVEVMVYKFHFHNCIFDGNRLRFDGFSLFKEDFVNLFFTGVQLVKFFKSDAVVIFVLLFEFSFKFMYLR